MPTAHPPHFVPFGASHGSLLPETIRVGRFGTMFTATRELHPDGAFVLWGARRRDVQIGSSQDRTIQAFRRSLAASLRMAQQFGESMRKLSEQTAIPAGESVAKLSAALRRIGDTGSPAPTSPFQ